MADIRQSRPASWRVAGAVAWVTVLEILRDKILYNILLLAGLLLGISYLSARLSFIRPERLMLDFGLSAVELSCAIIGVLVGSAMVGREFERRTILVALSRPITRLQYVGGKYLGLVGVLAINWAMLVAFHFTVVSLQTPEGTPGLGATYAAAAFLVLVESCVLAAIAVMFSTITTTSLAVMFSFGLYFVGANIHQLRTLALKSDPAVAVVLRAVSWMLPNLDLFRLGEKVTYRLPVGPGFVAWSTAYGVCLIVICLIGAGILVQRRES